MEEDITPPSPHKVHLPRITNTESRFLSERSSSYFSENYLMERINKELHVYSGIVEELNHVMMN